VFPWTAAVREGSGGGEARRRERYARDDEFAITCHAVSLLLIEASGRGPEGVRSYVENLGNFGTSGRFNSENARKGHFPSAGAGRAVHVAPECSNYIYA
jgi:hypothetical protein